MKKKVLIVISDYYREIGKNLLKGSTNELKLNNINYDVLFAPGCFEIPFLISKNIKKYRAFIALGCVIRGETYHFELIANECARKIIDLSNQHLKPIGFGILTCENIKQAKISAVGIGMRSQSGVAAKMFQTLSDEGVNIKVIATSEIKISVLIDRKYLELAVQSLHDAFELN